MANNTAPAGRGFLQVRVSTARDALPIGDALVTITARSDSASEGHALYSVMTDRSGLTAVFSLPAPPAETSERPGNSTPFAEYRIRVSAPRFLTQIFEGVPVFSGVTTVQPAALEPAPDDVANPAPQIFPPYSSSL